MLIWLCRRLVKCFEEIPVFVVRVKRCEKWNCGFAGLLVVEGHS